MLIVEYIDLYVAAMLNIMFCAIIIKKVFKVEITEKKRDRIAKILIPSLLVAIINYINKDVFKVLITLPIFVMGIKGIFNIGFGKSFLYVLGATMYMFIGEILVAMEFSLIPVGYEYIVTNILGRTIGCIAVIISTTPILYISPIGKMFRNIYDDGKMKKEKVVVSTIIILMLISAITYKNIMGVKDILTTMMNGIIIIVIASVIYSLYKESEKREELSKNYNVMLDYLGEYEKELVEKRKIIHDYKNEMIVINGYIGEEKKLREYVGEIIKEQRQIKESKAIRNIDKLPRGLKGLIYYKIKGLEEVVIDIEVKGNEKRIDEIDAKKSKDILKIVGIMLDNAIEAVEKEEEKYIGIKLEIKEDKFIIEMINTYSGEIEEEIIMKEGYSTKGKERGYGLSIVKDIIQKDKSYELQIRVFNDEFNALLSVTL